MTTAQDWVTLSLGIITLLSAMAGGWFKWVRPRIRRVSAEVTEIRDNILGRPAVVNEITKKTIAPAVPSLGTQLETLAKAVDSLARSHARLDEHEDRIASVEDDVKDLKDAAAERIVSRVESVQAWRAIEEAVKATPDEVVEATNE